MIVLKNFIVLLVLLQATSVFSYSWQVIWEVVTCPILQFGQIHIQILLDPPPAPSNAPTETQIAILKELQNLNEGIDTAIREIVNFKDELISYLEQTELNNLFIEIAALWNECRDILLTKEAGGFDSEEQFQEKFQDFRDKLEGIFLIVERIRFEKAKLYLERIRGELIESRVDFITYQVKLTLAIRDYVLHSSRVICLLNIVLSSDPQFKNSITRLSDDLKKFEKYHQQYVLGSWFNLTEHVLTQGSEIYYRGKILEIFGTRAHLLNWQDYYIGASNGHFTSFRATPASGADIGNFALFLEFQVGGVWRRLCASGEPINVWFDCETEEQQKWKPTPCPSSLIANEANLNYLCLNHVVTGATLTYLPTAENPGFLTLAEFNPNNGNQLFNFTDARPCCEIYSSPSWTGNSTKVCLGLDQGYLENASLSVPFSSVRCESEVRLVAFEGRHMSKRFYVVETGTEANFVDPSQATSMLSYYVQSVCSRIFSEENLTGDYRTVCGDIPNLQEQFVGKNISLLLMQPFELFDGPDYTGNSIILRRSMMNLQDWPFEVRSIRATQ